MQKITREACNQSIGTRIVRSIFGGAIPLLTLLVLFSPGRLQAQVGTGDILGTVTDSSGAVISDAKVTIKNMGTAEQRIATTNAKGEYTFSTLPNGSYALTVEVAGFKTYVAKGLPLSTGDRARYDAKMETGAVTETVQVTAEAATLQTDSSEVASTVPDTAVQELPLNNRNISSALTTQAGMSMGSSASLASGNAPEDRRPSFVIVANGQNDALNNQLIDGFDNNERNLGLAGVRPSVDGIEEVKIDTSSYSAEYGRAAGAVINVITKAGSNSYHGSAYEYFRNDIFDSRDFFAKTGSISKPEYRLNSFGGSAGGPVLKDKTFFFADFEQDRLVKGLSSTLLTVPTLQEETIFKNTGALDLTDADPTLAVIPAADVNPIMANYFSLFPAPNFAGPTTTVGYYTNNPPIVQTNTNIDGRIDQHFGSSDILFARVAYNPVTTQFPEAIPPITSGALAGIYPGGNGSTGFPGPSKTKSFNGQADFVHIFDQNLLTDFRMGYTRVNIASLPFNDNTGAAQKVGFAADINTQGVLPAMGGPGLAWTVLLGSTNSVPLVDINDTFQYAGSVTLTHGSHNLKAGVGVIRRQVNAFQDAIAGGFFLFFGAGGPFQVPYPDARQDFITGNPGLEIREDAVFNPGFRTWELNGYLQDDWRVSHKLTVNMGLRYDIFTPFTEAHGRFSNFLPSCLTSGTIAANCFVTGSQDSTVKVTADVADIAPRIGFAYSADAKTVLRGGFGMSYFPPDIGEASSGTGAPVSVMQNYNPPYSFNYQAFNPFGVGCSVATTAGGTTGCMANGPIQPSTVDLSTFASNPSVTSVSAKPLDIHSSYVEMVNLALQRQFGANNTMTIAYVGEFGRGLLRTINLDQPAPPGAGNPEPSVVYATQMPFVTVINHYYNGTMSAYQALQVIYAHNLARGLTANANYTWSHNLTNQGTTGSLFEGSPSIDYGNSAIDLRNRLSITANYEIPFGKSSSGLENLLVAGWKVNAVGYWQSGAPFTVYSTQSLLNVPNLDQDRPNVIASTTESNPGLNHWFNTSAFGNQTVGTQGDERIGQLYGPHQRNVDLSLNKNFALFRELKAEFRAECFNISNTPNFATPDNNETDTTFGAILSTTGGSNPRQFQFAMKFLF